MKEDSTLKKNRLSSKKFDQHARSWIKKIQDFLKENNVRDDEELAEVFIDIPEKFWTQYVEREYKKESYGVKNIYYPGGEPRLADFCRLAINENIRPMTPKEIRAYLYKEKGKDVPIYNINNTLSKSNGILIVDRGVYSSYEILPYTPDEIQQIREDAYAIMKSKSDFVSARSFRSEFTEKHPMYSGMNFYTLYGILQDDNRFSTWSGLLIGLTEFGKGVTLLSFVEQVVRDRGPITADAVYQELVDSGRDTNPSTAEWAIKENEEIIHIGNDGRNNLYDIRSRHFSDEELESFITAVKIMLQEHDMALYFIHSNWNRISGKSYKKHMIDSILRGCSEHFLYEGRLFSSLDKESLREYYEYVKTKMKADFSKEQIKDQMIADGKNIDWIDNLELDYRFYQIPPDDKDQKKPGGLIASIFQELS